MTVSSRALVELFLLGPINDRQHLQDTPILTDVWLAYATTPAETMDVLITPDKSQPAGPVAIRIARGLSELNLPRGHGQDSQISYLQGLVAARLFFEEILCVIVPMTRWWNESRLQDELKVYTDERLKRCIRVAVDWVKARTADARAQAAARFAYLSALDRYLSLAGIILWAAQQNRTSAVSAAEALKKPRAVAGILKLLTGVFQKLMVDPPVQINQPPQVWLVSLNHIAMPALNRSVPSVKGDAVRSVFKVNCENIRWAVLDSGIDGNHPAFLDKTGKSRVTKAFDFSNIRDILSLDNADTNTPAFKERLMRLRAGRERNLTGKEATDILKTLAEDAEVDRPVNWGLVENFISIDPGTPPASAHGTHVAGIIGAAANGNPDIADGMCPDIKFYDFRVLGRTIRDTEFAIIAALQYLRYLRDRHSYISIHGANLSLSIPHDVRNFACGRTPLCNECERLVESGILVVAAAGNLGYQLFETKDGVYEGYTAFSITDPGNADGVITVGSTHGHRPHAYGVSFFSSRGPTGDGRLKPDLVAPGERIMSCWPDGAWGEATGTSMAAAHVSGAAALLMGRYEDLIGEPRKIKQILCKSATDLGRERSFQGHGMLDVLRAFQSL